MENFTWWKEAVFYQIYPRSFADSNGDGIGDFPGITSRLDYLHELGVDALWLSPCFPSPLFDVGYDISDYTAIAPEYGSLDDFLEFLKQAHYRNIKVLLDLVLNHTSHQHPWFIESRSNKASPKRDWYIWRDGVGGDPPNNWESTFGGSAWEYDPETDQYYYHYFFKEQPDLNWRNPEVKQAMWEVVRYWLRLGVDGYRLDAIGTIFEDPLLENHASPISFSQLEKMFTDPSEQGHHQYMEIFEKIFEKQVDFPEVHDLMKELRQVVNEFPDRMLVGENEQISYYGNGEDELHLVFNFPLMRTNRLTPEWIRSNQVERLSAMPSNAWPCNTLGNHDASRVKSAFGDGEHDNELARLSLTLLLTLKGTPFLYYGEEIGMTDYLLDAPELFRDNLGTHVYQTLLENSEMDETEALKWAAKISRDRCRTPMQWVNAPAGGFSTNLMTWLPVNPDYSTGVNVQDQLAQPDSLLNFYKGLLHLRRNTPALLRGEYQNLNDDEDCFAFTRTSLRDNQTCLVILNMSGKVHNLELSGIGNEINVLYSNYKHEITTGDLYSIKLNPYEIFIGELSTVPNQKKC